METSEPSDTCELKTPDTSNCDSNCEKESLAHSGKRIQRKRIFLSQPVKSAFQTEIYLPPSKVNKQLFSSPPCTPVTLPTLHTPVTLPNSMPALMENQGKRIVRRRIFGQLESVKKPSIVTENKKSLCCIHDCESELTDDDIHEIKNHLRGKKISVKNILLKHLNSQENLGQITDKFMWKNKYLCLSILSKISEISKHILLDVFRCHYLGRKNIIHGNKGVHKEVLSTSKFIVWMKDFAGRYGQNSPDAQVLVLNHWLTKKKMFHIYCNEMDPPLVRTLLLGLNTLVLNYSLIQKCPRFHFLSICVLICITFFFV